MIVFPLVGYISKYLLLAAPVCGCEKEKPSLQVTSFCWDMFTLLGGFTPAPPATNFLYFCPPPPPAPSPPLPPPSPMLLLVRTTEGVRVPWGGHRGEGNNHFSHETQCYLLWQHFQVFLIDLGEIHRCHTHTGRPHRTPAVRMEC